MLYNMVGNVWEWTAQNFKLRSLKRDMRQLHADKQGFKICKGGSYLCHESYCHRYSIAPAPPILQTAQPAIQAFGWFMTARQKTCLQAHPCAVFE